MLNDDRQGFPINQHCHGIDNRYIFESLIIMCRTVSLLLLVILCVVESAEIDEESPITSKTWFWPFLAIAIVLVISIPCTFVAMALYCRQRQLHLDDDDTSSVNSETSVSSIVVRERSQRRHLPRSYHASGIRTPPPPYTSNERPKTIFLTSSPPPSYRSEGNDNLPVQD